MREVLVLVASIMLGAGLGLLLSDYTLQSSADVQAAVIIQPVVASILGIFALLAKPRSRYWMPALAVTFASAWTAAGVRVAATALDFARESTWMRMQLPFTSEFPRSTLDQSMLALLAVSLAILLGQMLLMDGFARQLSPLWVGVESLSTTVEPPARIMHGSSILGAPIGVTLAWFEVRSPILGGFPWIFTSMYALLLPASVAFTSSVHLLLQYSASSFVSEGLESSLLSVRVGVQAGLLASLIVAAVLLHGRGGAALYPTRVANIVVSATGLLLILLSYVVVGLLYATYLLVSTVAMLIVTLLVAIRLEGGAFALLYPVNPWVPELLQLTWASLTALCGELFRVQDAESLMRLLANPYSLLLLAAMTLWEVRLLDDVRGAALVPAAITAPLLLLLARAALFEEYAQPPRLTSWALPTVGGLSAAVQYNIVVIVAGLTAVASLIVHYGVSPTSRWRYAKLLLDPNGLMFAYSVSPVLARGSMTVLLLLVFVVVSAFRVLLAARPSWQKVKGLAQSALLAYGITILLLLLGLRISK